MSGLLIDVYNHPCPTCKVDEGEPCRSVEGGTTLGVAHLARRMSAAAAMQPVVAVAVVAATCRWGHGRMQPVNGGLSWRCPECDWGREP